MGMWRGICRSDEAGQTGVHGSFVGSARLSPKTPLPQDDNGLVQSGVCVAAEASVRFGWIYGTTEVVPFPSHCGPMNLGRWTAEGGGPHTSC
jgi:hypothetical protein